MKSIRIYSKQSGNFILSEYSSTVWDKYAVCDSPQALYNSIHELAESFKRYPVKLILKEYRFSQRTCSLSNFTKKDALQAFYIPATKANIEEYFK